MCVCLIQLSNGMKDHLHLPLIQGKITIWNVRGTDSTVLVRDNTVLSLTLVLATVVVHYIST